MDPQEIELEGRPALTSRLDGEVAGAAVSDGDGDGDGDGPG
jgi:hypothetical protein